MSRELRKSWAAATELLNERQRVEEALLAAELEIPGLISARLQSQNELSEQEADSAFMAMSIRIAICAAQEASSPVASKHRTARWHGSWPAEKTRCQLEALAAIRI